VKYKPDWPEAAERWAALWEGRFKDRPCMVVTAPSGSAPVPTPTTPPPSPEAYWLDPACVLPRVRATLEGTCWAGEAIPSYLLLAGWVTMASGSTPRFPPGRDTIWFDEIEVDWERPPSFAFDPDDPWLRRYQALHRAVAEAAGRDGFLVGSVCALPGNDMLSMLLGTQRFLENLVDRPEWMRAAIGQLAEKHVRVQEHFAGLTRELNDFWYGNAGWAVFWGPQRFQAVQSDVSCMLGPDMFTEFILPELDLLGRRFGRLWYHLDGPDAVRHLPALCSRDYLRVIQYVPGAGKAGNGPAWMDLYRRIQAAGRVVHVDAHPAQVEALIRGLDPGLLCIETRVESEREAQDLLISAKHWTSAKFRACAT